MNLTWIKKIKYETDISKLKLRCFIFLNPRKDQDLSKEIYFKIFCLEFKFVQILEVCCRFKSIWKLEKGFHVQWVESQAARSCIGGVVRYRRGTVALRWLYPTVHGKTEGNLTCGRQGSASSGGVSGYELLHCDLHTVETE
jgi:hypothetical protein